MKKGRLSKTEMQFITESAEVMTVESIAEKLERDPVSISEFIKRNLQIGVSDEEDAAFTLKKRPYWRELKLQFTENELDLFQYHWTNIIMQFKDNVIHTEELQVIDLIKLELLMNRSLKLSKSSNDQIEQLEERIRIERALDPEIAQIEQVLNMERQVASLKASQESMTKDYRELQTKKNSMLKEMRATREQRVKDIEESKQTFVGFLKHLISNPDVVKGYGMEMEKMRLAMEAERVRLSAYHTYEDGQIDQPFLVPGGVLNPKGWGVGVDL